MNINNFLYSYEDEKNLLLYKLSVKMLSRSYWQILPGGQYPASPRGKVAFALLPQNLNQEGGDRSKEAGRQGEPRSVSAVERINDNSSISSSSASSTFSPGEEDIPPFLTDQRSHLQATTQNGKKQHQTPTFSSDGESINLSGSEKETRLSTDDPSIENNCCEPGLQNRDRNYEYYESNANESRLNVADSDSISSGNNKSNGGAQIGRDGPTLFSGIQAIQGRKCSLTESRVASASTQINSNVVRIFNPETLDSSVMTSQ